MVDQGETFLLEATFKDGNEAPAEGASIASICMTADADFAVTEDLTAASFDNNDNMDFGYNNCKTDSTVTVSAGTAVIGPLTFLADNNGNVVPDATVTGIGICQTKDVAGSEFENCVGAQTKNSGFSGILFVAIDTADVTLAEGETIDVTYTFDISSPNS